MIKKELVTELTESEFLRVIDDRKVPLVIVDFFAEWCMPCMMMSPILESIAEKNPKIKFVRINVDDAQELANKYEVSSIPCIIFFKEGKEVDRVTGLVPEDVLREKVEDYLRLE